MDSWHAEILSFSREVIQIAVDSLVDPNILAIKHPSEANQIFLVADGIDLSSLELIARMAQLFGEKPTLIPVPERLLRLVVSIVGSKAAAGKLCNSLRVYIRKTKNLFGWQPPVTVDEGFRCTVVPLV